MLCLVLMIIALRKFAHSNYPRHGVRIELLLDISHLRITQITRIIRPISVRVLVITGAGVSAESGIPTFRAKNGYWRNFDPAKLATPEAFARDPKLVWEWYRERRQRIRNAQPNAAHETIAKLAQHAAEFLLVTQNVDDLHARAGVSPERMVQIHGNIFVTRCSRCDFERRDYPPSVAAATYCAAGEHPPSPRASEAGLRRTSEHEQEGSGVPKCPRCDELMRPGVVWFGEQLPWNELQRVENFLDRGGSDFVIVAGTTATFGYIVDWALRAKQDDGELIEVNPEETPLSQFATRLVREPAAIALPKLVDQFISQTKQQ
jgi:NAD-dependent deacetylase